MVMEPTLPTSRGEWVMSPKWDPRWEPVAVREYTADEVNAMTDGFERAQSLYDAMMPPEPDPCPKCGDDLDSDGKCQDEECGHIVCCYPNRCWCGDPRV